MRTSRVIVINIPSHFHAVDLRAHFSSFVEGEKFKIFHFRHRLLKLLNRSVFRIDIPPKVSNDSSCGFALINNVFLGEFFELYNLKNWTDKNKETIPEKCYVIQITSKLMFSEFDALKEFKLPNYLTRGNIGTSTKQCLELIQKCLLPASLIRKLGLEFPKMKYWRKYGNVQFNYSSIDNTEESDDEETEEWDRHLSTKDDATSQERTKERLYEEELEVVWEKGGSGLVFYTDAQYWDEKDGDFDEKTADYWDVDMSCYYEEEAGDKDARDMLQLRKEMGLRNGTVSESAFKTKSSASQMPSYSRKNSGSKLYNVNEWGIGKKLLIKQGWKEGQGLGKKQQGISEALECEGQTDFDKRGIGYYGEKLNRYYAKQTLPRQPHDVIISTKFDLSENTDPQSHPLRRNPPTFNKNR